MKTTQEQSDPGVIDAGLSSQRLRWIQEHNDFLSAALGGGHRVPRVPRIPRRRVDQGGFSVFLTRPGVKALMEKCWLRLLEGPTPDR